MKSAYFNLFKTCKISPINDDGYKPSQKCAMAHCLISVSYIYCQNIVRIKLDVWCHNLSLTKDVQNVREEWYSHIDTSRPVSVSSSKVLTFYHCLVSLSSTHWTSVINTHHLPIYSSRDALATADMLLTVLDSRSEFITALFNGCSNLLLHWSCSL